MALEKSEHESGDHRRRRISRPHLVQAVARRGLGSPGLRCCCAGSAAGSGTLRRCSTSLRDPLPLPQGIEAVFYLAQSPRYRDFPQAADDLFGVNTYGAVKAAEAALAAGAGLLCYASTGNVYQPSLAPLAESCPLDRENPYALSKLAAEEVLRLFRPHLPVISRAIVRPVWPGAAEDAPRDVAAEGPGGRADCAGTHGAGPRRAGGIDGLVQLRRGHGPLSSRNLPNSPMHRRIRCPPS